MRYAGAGAVAGSETAVIVDRWFMSGIQRTRVVAQRTPNHALFAVGTRMYRWEWLNQTIRVARRGSGVAAAVDAPAVHVL